MKPISRVLPLPGMGEFESIAKALISLLKDGESYTDKGAALIELLESMMVWADKMDHLAEFAMELRTIQRHLQVANKSKSRQWKLIIWDDLNARLNQKIICTMLKLVAQSYETQSHKAQTEQAVVLSRHYQIIKGHQIKDEVEIHAKTWLDPEHESYPTGRKPVKITLRSGRLEEISVVHLTFAAGSEIIARDLAVKEIKYIRQLNHVNVARFVGVTESYSGLYGIVVAMDGIDFYDFLSRTHSGTVWSKCIRGFEAFTGSTSKWTFAEKITVSSSGHVTMFPARFGRMPTRFAQVRYNPGRPTADRAVELLMRMYSDNYGPLGSNRLCTFVNSLANLGLGFTELQLIKIAAACGLFPLSTDSYNEFGVSPLPDFQPEVGCFGQAGYRNGSLADWKVLGRSRHAQKVNLDAHPGRSGLKWCKSSLPGSTGWLTCTLRDTRSHSPRRDVRLDCWSCSNRNIEPFRFDWGDILTEAKEISQHPNVKLDDISFLWASECSVFLTRPEDASWNEIPTTLYYHWNPQSSNAYESMGFYSVYKTPDGGAWQNQMKSRGWEFEFTLMIVTYRMRNDWSCQYKRKLRRVIAATPGTYPEVQTEAVSEQSPRQCFYP